MPKQTKVLHSPWDERNCIVCHEGCPPQQRIQMAFQPSDRPEVPKASNCFFEIYNALLTHLILLRRLTGMDLAPPCIEMLLACKFDSCRERPMKLY
ncbi:MAG: hypothetical protein IPJ48_21005 [Propionivibrio sp.]|uniref:Uncharacterized protein n=1 Tax=Candidatus Propionivibrio dominans TaxID=2954373 RepID=A0A9D7FG62_9RHOO|nr:hypothetical protein [Candidatus Propionivibrio dominans]MBL0167238.1 hypothetical protein [Propionivibrio sp.]